MIGFLPQTTKRRPIYSLTGQKLCYLVSGPEGEWIYTVEGQKWGKVKQHKWLAKLEAVQSMAGSVTVDAEEGYEL